MKMKLFIVIIAIILGAFIGLNTASAQTASVSCNSAVISDFITLQNGITTNAWFEWGPTQYFGNSTPLQVLFSNSNFSQMITGLSDNTTYYYRVVMNSGIGGNTTGYTKSFRTPLCHSIAPSGNLSVRTNSPTNVGNDSATLGGTVLANNDIYTTGYFEYGTTQWLGSTTSNKNLGSMQSNSFYETLVSLTPGTTYFYRAVISNQYGTSRGNIVSFRTGSPVVYRSTTQSANTNSTVKISSSSSVFLSVTQNDETVRKGSGVEYKINYKNNSSRNLRDAVLQISVPKELEFVTASRGYFSPENSLVIANIGNLDSQEEGSVHVIVQATAGAQTGKIIVIKASLAYTITNSNVQEEVFAYLKNTVEDGTIAQGATAFLFGGGFMPSTLLGYLSLILLLVLLVLAVRKAYYNPIPIVVSETTAKKHD